jgi:hypothetical protein
MNISKLYLVIVVAMSCWILARTLPARSEAISGDIVPEDAYLSLEFRKLPRLQQELAKLVNSELAKMDTGELYLLKALPNVCEDTTLDCHNLEIEQDHFPIKYNCCTSCAERARL